MGGGGGGGGIWVVGIGGVDPGGIEEVGESWNEDPQLETRKDPQPKKMLP